MKHLRRRYMLAMVKAALLASSLILSICLMVSVICNKVNLPSPRIQIYRYESLSMKVTSRLPNGNAIEWEPKTDELTGRIVIGYVVLDNGKKLMCMCLKDGRIVVYDHEMHTYFWITDREVKSMIQMLYRRYLDDSGLGS